MVVFVGSLAMGPSLASGTQLTGCWLVGFFFGGGEYYPNLYAVYSEKKALSGEYLDLDGDSGLWVNVKPLMCFTYYYYDFFFSGTNKFGFYYVDYGDHRAVGTYYIYKKKLSYCTDHGFPSNLTASSVPERNIPEE